MQARRRTVQLLLTLAALPVLLVIPVSLAAHSASASEFRGRYVIAHSDDFSAGKANFRPALELTNGDVVNLDYGPGGRPNVNPGSRVRLRGERRGNRIVVAAGSTEVTSSSTTASSAGGSKRVAVVLFNFSNDSSQPYTPATAQGVAFTNTNSVTAYYGQSSWAQLTLFGDVYGWYTIASSNSGCAYSTWASQANQAASAAGVNLDAYDNVVYAFPQASSCGWAGLASMPGKYSWLNGSMAMTLSVMAHELGHNFGTHHASDLKCIVNGVRVSLSASASNCTTGEYGDPFTVMGTASRFEHTNFSRGNFGWLQASNTKTVTTDGDYVLRPVEVYDPPGIQSLRIQRTPSTFLTLEFRQPSTTFDSFTVTNPVVTGVTVRITPDYATRSQSQLVDATPETMSFSDSPLTVGRTLTDPLTGVSITTLAVASTGATVRVSFGPSPPPPTADTTAPSQPGALSATPLDANRASLSWTPGTDNVGVTGYRVFRNSSLVTTVTGTGWTDTGLTPATTYAYEVVAVDAAGNTSSPASASATTPSTEPPPPGDTTAPTAPTNVLATSGKGKRIILTWLASTDDTGVAGYRVIRDDKQVGDTQTTSYSDTLGGKSPTAVYHVVAYDAAGNVSGRSLPLTVP